MRLAVWKRLAAAALAAFLCLAQAGCSFSVLDAQNLMSPPRANLEQQGIYELLQGDGQELTFVYPKRREHRSAIIMRDWTGDGVEDAIGFVSPEGGGVEVSFLEKGESAWRIAASFSNTATQVDMVLFGDLNGDGREDVLIGWGSASGTTGRTAAVDAYLFDGENVTEYLLGTYGEMTATDFDGDGVIEVFTVDKYLAAEEEGAEDLPALAHLFAWEEGALQELASTAADNGFGVIIAGAGTAAHLGGVLAAYTTLPVIGVPIKTSMMGGLDSLLSMVQMPSGVPVATVAVNGAANAAILAAQMLAIGDPQLQEALAAYKQEMAETVAAKDAKLQADL